MGRNTYNLLLLFKLGDFGIELLKAILEFILVFEDGNLILFFNSELHLAHLKSFLKLVAFRLQVLPPLLLLSSRLVALV